MFVCALAGGSVSTRGGANFELGFCICLGGFGEGGGREVSASVAALAMEKRRQQTSSLSLFILVTQASRGEKENKRDNQDAT